MKETHRNRRIGRTLLEEALSHARKREYRKVVLKIGNSSLRQLFLYQRMGFRMVAINENYFSGKYKNPLYEDGIRCLDQVELEYRLYSREEISRRIEGYWESFLSRNPQYRERIYEVWSFGHGSYQANSLIALVKQGEKVATASALDMYEPEEKVPEKGDLSIVTYGNGLPGCIIETVDIRIKPFDKITAEEAALEGEGDLSLDYWREAHRHFIAREYREKGMPFHERIPVIFEQFRVVYNEDEE